jgi:hypothetical protein
MGVFERGGRLWISWKNANGQWRNKSTGLDVGQEDEAEATYREVLALVKAQLPAPKPAAADSVRAYYETWLPKRREADLDWRNDRSRTTHHVLPYIGDMALADVRAKQIAEHHQRRAGRYDRKVRRSPAPVRAVKSG